jgi:DNA repair exonuclease SbcCD ATPase subunit
MITELQSHIKNVKHIIHFADVHIRLTQRHQEYKEVFNNFFKIVSKLPDVSETIMVFCGDLLHNKDSLSPESIQLAYDFLKETAEIMPIICISGNHDALLANKDRLDSLTPIINALSNKNIYYLKSSGLYEFSNILFNNFSIFDGSEKYIYFPKIPKIYTNKYEHFIALYHGPVDNALTDLGYTVSNKSMPLEVFDGHHMVFLGDIHCAQDLQLFDFDNDTPAVRYPGSFCQNNHGESLVGHGFSLWDLKSKTYKHIEIPNDYGFFTIEINKGKLITNLKNIPKKARLRIKCFESVATEVKSVLSEARKHSDIQEVIYVRVDSENNKTKLILENEAVLAGNLSNREYQNKIIKEYLEAKLNIKDKEKINGVLKLNDEFNLLIEKESATKNITWKPIRFEWNNMFSYGEGNFINFSNLKGIVGLFGPNTAGKTSLGSALSFCMFDKFDKAYKASDVLNIEKMGFDCKFHFDINNTDYFIYRKGLSDKKGNIRVNVQFWKEKDGKKEELTGVERYDTNENIRNYIGSYDDFVLTTLSVQNVKNTNSFIDMGNTERKDLLAKFLGLNIFDKLYGLASDRNNKVTTLLDEYKKDDFTQKLIDTNSVLVSAELLYKSESEKSESLHIKRDQEQQKIIEETKKLIKIDINIPDISDLNKKKVTIEQDLSNNISEISALDSIVVNKRDELVSIEKQIDSFDKENIKEKYELYKKLLNALSGLQNKIDAKKVDVKNKLDKLNKLKEHKYDPNCKFCINNIFVKDAIRTQNELDIDKKESEELVEQLQSLKTEISSKSGVETEYKNYSALLVSRYSVKDEYNKKYNRLTRCTAKIDLDRSELKLVERNIQLYHENKQAIEQNKVIDANVAQLNTALRFIDNTLSSINNTLLDLSGKIALLKKQINDIKQKSEKAELLEKENELYELYLKSINRDGIPYEIIFKIIPELEKEINTILNQIVEFQIKIEADGKNLIPYIVYNDKKWALGMSSGMERFISSIAIRVALINIAAIPKPAFLILDEGFSALDSDARSSLSSLFSFLKANFEFIIIISHLDELKDMVDSVIEIKKINGFSHIEHD